MRFVKQRFQLIGSLRELLPQLEYAVARIKSGWNFIGVVDSDGDQTEDHFGAVLKNSDGTAVNAAEYLGDYIVALRWDPIVGRFEALQPSVTMTIGDGVWVYY